MPVFKIVNHSKKVLGIAKKHGWLSGARYTNLRDVREIGKIGFIDIDWKNYNFDMHLEAVKRIRPMLTVAKDVLEPNQLETVLEQAKVLQRYSRKVIIVPKAIDLAEKLEEVIPKNYILGYSVPTKYGGTEIHPGCFKRKVHLLGGRPDVQRRLANDLQVFSMDCNRFTLDAAFGDYFDGETFRPHPEGGYERCVENSIININKLWSDYL